VRPVSMTIGWVAVWAPRTPIEFLDWMGRLILDVHMGRPIASAGSSSGGWEIPTEPAIRNHSAPRILNGLPPKRGEKERHF